jgi:hypothetical protein
MDRLSQVLEFKIRGRFRIDGIGTDLLGFLDFDEFFDIVRFVGMLEFLGIVEFLELLGIVEFLEFLGSFDLLRVPCSCGSVCA